MKNCKLKIKNYSSFLLLCFDLRHHILLQFCSTRYCRDTWHKLVRLPGVWRRWGNLYLAGMVVGSLRETCSVHILVWPCTIRMVIHRFVAISHWRTVSFRTFAFFFPYFYGSSFCVDQYVHFFHCFETSTTGTRGAGDYYSWWGEKTAYTPKLWLFGLSGGIWCCLALCLFTIGGFFPSEGVVG